MIKNIVFDIGNVLCTFVPERMLQEKFENPQIEEKLYGIYFSSLWDQYDRNTVTKGEMIEIGVLQAPELKEEIIRMMNEWTNSVKTIDENMAVLQHLHDLGYNIYILSNIPHDCYQYLKENGLFKFVDGGIYSFQEHKIKPDFDIYKALLDQYRLDSSECLFIDDKKSNIESADTLGFYTIHLEDPYSLASEIREFLEQE